MALICYSAGAAIVVAAALQRQNVNYFETTAGADSMKRFQTLIYGQKLSAQEEELCT
jgi:hypothetical protein